MKVNEMIHLLDAKLISGSPELEVHTACGSDMMSDVLAFVKDQAVLLTGLVNPQVVRTADMMDIHCVVFVRGKEPDNAMISLAEDRGMVLMTTQKRMFTACGLLYQAGLRGGDDE
ncbi:MAG: hypothetical protein ACOYJR_01270 [Acutalibacteraceae bacterium]